MLLGNRSKETRTGLEGCETKRSAGGKPWRKGFTLIELLVVIAIIAILALIALPNFLEAQIRAKISRAKADMRSYATGLEAYYVDYNDYVWGINSRSTVLGIPLSPFVFKWLTTPVAYVTDTPNDPFIEYHGDSKGWARGLKAPFVYQTTHPYKLGPPPNNAEKCAYIAFLNGYRWYMCSIGPYRLKALNAEVFYHGGYQGSTAMFPYDPTNGTASMGYIYRSNRGNDDNQIPAGPALGSITPPAEW